MEVVLGKVRVEWNASPYVKALIDKAVELEVEDDQKHDRTPFSRSSMLNTIMRRCLTRYLAEREAIRKQPSGETHA